MPNLLRDFVKMRESLHKKQPSDTVANKKINKEIPLDSITLDTIIENKPSSKEVLKYFQRLTNCLEDSD
jgi:hypothetical protein